MNGQASTRQAIRQLLNHQQLGVLSTVGDKNPYASLVAFAVSEDDEHLFFVTSRNTRKYANITTNAQVSLLVHNSGNQPEDFERASAVTAIGTAAPVSPDMLDGARRIYLAKHPNLKDFIADSHSELVDIRVKSYILVEHFQLVTEYRIDH